MSYGQAAGLKGDIHCADRYRTYLQKKSLSDHELLQPSYSSFPGSKSLHGHEWFAELHIEVGNLH